MTYRTKQEAYDAGFAMGELSYGEKLDDAHNAGIKEGIKQERARLKRKAIVNPLYNRPIDLKERVNREAEVEFSSQKSPEFKREFVDRFIKKQPFSIIKWIKKYLP